MSRIEKRLWIIWLSVFTLALGAAYGISLSNGEPFPQRSVTRIRQALRPDREPRKIEKATSLEGLETLKIQTSAANVLVQRNENLNELAITLEGQFVKSAKDPLIVKKETKTLRIQVEEGLKKRPWRLGLDEETRNAVLTLSLPRQFAGRLEVETVSGDTTLEELSLGGFEWSSVSGELQSAGGEIHSARLESVSGNISYFGNTPDFKLTSTSADATVVLPKIETAVSPQIDAGSVSGRIDVSVPAAASMRISISSLTGEATSSLALQKSAQSKGAFEGVIGSGGGELRLRSVSGNVRLTTLKSD